MLIWISFLVCCKVVAIKRDNKRISVNVKTSLIHSSPIEVAGGVRSDRVYFAELHWVASSCCNYTRYVGKLARIGVCGGR
jgi:hypothetical protein